MLKKLKKSIHCSYLNNVFLYFTLIIVLSFFILSTVFYNRAVKCFNVNMENNLDLISAQYSASVNNYISSKLYSLKQISENKDVKDYLTTLNAEDNIKDNSNYNRVNDLLGNIKTIDPDINLAWVVSDSYNFLTADNGYISADDYNMKTRPWYPNLVSNPDPEYIWVSPLVISATTGNETVMIVSPIIENGNLIGYAGIDIFKQNINNAFSNIPTSKGIYPIIVAEDGSLIYKDITIEDSLFSLTNISVSNTINNSVQTDSGVDKFKSGSLTNYISYQKSYLTDWRILIGYDTKEASNINTVFLIEQIVTLNCFGVLIIILIWIKLRSSLKTVPKIMKAIDNISNGNLDYKIKSPLQNEFGQISNFTDNISTELKNKISLIEQYSNYDILTGLASRYKLFQHLSEYITYAKEHKTKFAVVFFDIDNFKWVNDTLGHNFGDEFLKCFSKKLYEIINNFGVLSRFSGDEFLALISFDTNVSEIDDIIEKIKHEFKEPIKISDDEMYVRFSIGVSVYPDDDLSEELLIRDADIAINMAKEHDVSSIEYYNNSLHKSVATKALIAQKLSSALDNNEFYLNYQPIISTSTREIHGFEVLLRWTNDTIGTIPPSEFIPIAEDTGAILPIGTWIFETACRFHETLCKKIKKDIIISINVSPQQLLQPDYVENIKRVLSITNIKPQLIQLEITESVLVTLFDSANDVLKQLCDFGITIALDDFGTGYSSLNYLKRFPINCLKIDKSFVDEIYNNKKDYAITDSIIELVHHLDITTVAEGVETVGQYNSLNKMNCDLIQGYLMSKPLTEAQVLEFIELYNLTHNPD